MSSKPCMQMQFVENRCTLMHVMVLEVFTVVSFVYIYVSMLTNSFITEQNQFLILLLWSAINVLDIYFTIYQLIRESRSSHFCMESINQHVYDYQGTPGSGSAAVVNN